MMAARSRSTGRRAVHVASRRAVQDQTLQSGRILLSLQRSAVLSSHLQRKVLTCFIDDNEGVKKLLSQTLELITDDRVRLFAVAAQVVDVEQKIDSAITECMRLGTHAIRYVAEAPGTADVAAGHSLRF